ncbi:MAG: glyoxalase superfamily protein [Candidatus Sulfotelmatobacter sp.]
MKAATAGTPKKPRAPSGPPFLKDVTPVLCVRDVKACTAFFQQKLGFKIDFLHGVPPFYGAVSRDGVCLHMRYVQQPYFAQTATQEKSLIFASIQVSNVQGLFKEFKARGVEFAQTLKKQAWGGTDFQLRDPDGNVISFVTYG